MNPELKRQLVSGAITFITGFLLFVGPALQNMDTETLSKGSIVALIFAGARAGVKMLVEWFLLKK